MNEHLKKEQNCVVFILPTPTLTKKITLSPAGVLSFLLREIQMSTQVIWKYFNKILQNKVNFPDVILILSKILCVLPSILCMTGEQSPSQLIWHQDIRVTHCQSSAMILSSRNTLSVTHSDTASYVFNKTKYQCLWKVCPIKGQDNSTMQGICFISNS